MLDESFLPDVQDDDPKTTDQDGQDKPDQDAAEGQPKPESDLKDDPGQKPDQQTKDTDEPEKVENPFSDSLNPLVPKYVKARNRVKELERKVEELESKTEPQLPDVSPLKQWKQENPDEDYAPADVMAEENEYWFKKNQQLAQQTRQQTPDANPQKSDLEQALDQDQNTLYALELASKYLSNEEWEALKEHVADLPVDQAIKGLHDYAAYVVQERGSVLHKSVMAEIRKQASQRKPDPPESGKPKPTGKGEKPENNDDELGLDFSGFQLPGFLNFVEE